MHRFTGGSDGALPTAGLIRSPRGSFYGTAFQGGANGCGVVFRISKTGKEAALYSFACSGEQGANPSAGVVRDSDGNLYGTTPFGGSQSRGTIFKLTAAGGGSALLVSRRHLRRLRSLTCQSDVGHQRQSLRQHRFLRRLRKWSHFQTRQFQHRDRDLQLHWWSGWGISRSYSAQGC